MRRIVCTVLAAGVIFAVSHAAPGSFKYETKGKRDPFIPLIGPDKAKVSGVIDIVSIDDVNLEGIAFGAKGRRSVIMNGEILKEGDKVGEVEVRKITKSTVTISIGVNEYTLNIQEPGGPKSE